MRIEMVATMATYYQALLRGWTPGPTRQLCLSHSWRSIAVPFCAVIGGDRRAETAFLDDGTRERFEHLATALARCNTHIKSQRISDSGVWIEGETLALLDRLIETGGALKQ